MGTSARSAVVHVNAFDLSSYFRGMDVQDEVGLEDTTTWGTSILAKSWTRTLYEATLSLKGFWNATATSGVNAVIRAALGNATQSVVSIWPTGDAVGQVGFGFLADVASRKVAGAVDGVLTIEAEFKSSVGDEEITSLHALAAETLDGNGTTVDFAAASANGGAVYLHCSDITTDNAITVRGSTDNFAANDTLLATFTTVTVDRTSQRVAITGTIPRYVRVVWNLTGSSTFSVGIHRRPSA